MSVAAPGDHPAGRLEIASPERRSALTRLHASGGALRLAPSVYAVGATLPVDRVAHHHRLAVLAHFWPEAVVCDRSALAGAEPTDGWLFACHPDPPRTADLRLPGVTLCVRRGPGPLPGDMPMPHGLHLSGVARGLVENVTAPGRPPRGRPSRRAGTGAVEDRIDEMARTGGTGLVRRTLAELDVVAGHLLPMAVDAVRQGLAAVLGTTPTSALASPRLAARVGGEPYDEHRLQMLDRLVAHLVDVPPQPRPALGGPSRWQWLPFFESYFSNFIEGAEFTVEEARQIALEGVVPIRRPEDAHDVAATYRITSDPTLAAARATSGEDLMNLLRARHETLMAARPDRHPGQFKTLPNQAGGYRFVDPDAVPGTLRRGFDALAQVRDPLHRAVALMLLVTEVHPFDDGNGRVARLLANAELSAAGQVRIVIPTIYRTDYLAGLAGVSNGAGRGESLLAVLGFAQRWTSLMTWDHYATADAELREVHAYTDAGVAEASGLRLRLPRGPGAPAS